MDQKKILTLYRQGKGIKAISKEVGLTPTAIKKRLIKAGIYRGTPEKELRITEGHHKGTPEAEQHQTANKQGAPNSQGKSFDKQAIIALLDKAILTLERALVKQ